MREQGRPNPLGRFLGGGSIIAISLASGRNLDAFTDPVSAAYLGFFGLIGLGVVGAGLFSLAPSFSPCPTASHVHG